MFFSVNLKGKFTINYRFHYTDLENWKEILKIHIEYIEKWKLINNNLNKEVILEEIRDHIYYDITIESEEYKLYLNIHYLFYWSNNKGYSDKENIKNLNNALKNGQWER